MKQIHNFINGAYTPSNKTFEKRSPVTGEVIAMVHEASASDVNQAVEAAHAALNGPWGRMITDCP